MAIYNETERIEEIRRALEEGKTEEAIYLTKRLAGDISNQIPEVSKATQGLLKGEVTASELISVCERYEKKIMDEVLEKARRNNRQF